MALLIGAGVMAAIQSGKAPAALALVRADLGMGLILAGVVVSMFHAIVGVLGVFAGMLGDSFGHRRFLLGGLALIALGCALSAFAPDAAVLIGGRFVEGIGFVGVLIAAPALLIQVAAARDRQLVFGLFGVNFPLGVGLVMLVAPAIAEPLGWRALWLANVVLIAVFLAIAVAATRPLATAPAAAPAPGRLRHDLTQVARSPGPWLIAAIFTVYGTFWTAVVLWLPAYMVEVGGHSVALAGVVGAVVVGANALGNVVGARLGHRGVPSWAVIAGAGAGMGASAIFVFAPWTPEAARYVAAFLFSLLGGLVPSSLFSTVPSVAPSARLVGTTLGLMLQGGHLGTFVGPPAFAALVGLAGGWGGSSWPLLVTGLLVAVLALALRHATRPAARR